MKKIIVRLVLVVCLLALTTLIVVPAAADSVVTIGLDSTEVPEGDTFPLRIQVEGVENFDAAQYDITYDETVLEVTGVADGLIGSTIIPAADSWAYIPADTQGTIRVVNNIPGLDGVTGSGYLSVIYFQAIGAAGTSSNITISDGLLGDITATAITTNWPPSPATVNIIASVVAEFTSDVTEVLVGETVSFTAEPSGGTAPYTYAWDFENDGSTDNTSANPIHSYNTIGQKTVSLTVTDAADDSNTVTKTGYITVYGALDAVATANNTQAIPGQLILFGSAGTTGGKTPYTYSWNFGDGSPAGTTASLEHNYTATGNYTVTLTVTDALGNTDAADTWFIQVCVAGDSDGNGIIQAIDITYLEHAIMEHPGYDRSSWCDLDMNGEWDATDMVAIRNIILERSS